MHPTVIISGHFLGAAFVCEKRGFSKMHCNCNGFLSSHIQTKQEGKLFERLEINWKFGKLISTIIEKSWPKDHQGRYQEDEEVVLQHLLSWSAAKNIFQLHGMSIMQNHVKTHQTKFLSFAKV